MCDGTLLPHCGHLLSCAACQRFAAFRVRNRIFDVLRFGTPIAGAYQSITTQENNNRSVIPSEVEESRGTPDSKFAGSFGSAPLRMTPLRGSTFELQLVQRAPIRFSLRILVFGFDLFGLANSITVSVAMRMCG